MSPDLNNAYARNLQPDLNPDLERVTEDLTLAYFGTVEAGGNLEDDSFKIREPDEYTNPEIALHPQFKDGECDDDLIEMVGRDGLLDIISNPELGLMRNFKTEYIPAIKETIEDSGTIEAMEAGRPVVFLSDHDNWAAVALMGIGVSAALRELDKPELAEKVALSIGLAASSFNDLEVGPFKVDQMKAINMFCDILKSSPDSLAREVVRRAISTNDLNEEDDPLRQLNEKTKTAFWDVLHTGGAIVSGISGTHDIEKDKSVIMKEPGPGSANALFSERVLELDPLYIPCVSLCNPFETGTRKATEGHFEAYEEFNFSDRATTSRERMSEVMHEIQLMKAIALRRTVEIEAHERWEDADFGYRPISSMRAFTIRGGRKTKAAVIERRMAWQDFREAHEAKSEES